MIEIMKRVYCMFQPCRSTQRSKLHIRRLDAVERHISGECLDIHKVYIIGRQILESDRTVFLTFANGWMLCFDLSLQAMWRNYVGMYHRTQFNDNDNLSSTSTRSFMNVLVASCFARSKVQPTPRTSRWVDASAGRLGETRATERFEQHWCGPTKGHWLLAHGGIGMTGNIQGVELTWRWDRFAISHRLQVCNPWLNFRKYLWSRLRGSNYLTASQTWAPVS